MRKFFSLIRWATIARRARRGLPAVILAALWCPAIHSEARDFRTVDPSGQWCGLHGVLSLMLTGDALSFSYSSVFGATAHICDGASVAGLVVNGEYQNVDDQGTVSFLVTDGEVRMLTTAGIPSFCGAGWPGETFSKDGYKPPSRCRVTAEKSHFHGVMPSPPEKRKAYVVKGDRVETVPACHEGGDDWVLARYAGAKIKTVGLLRKDTLECSECIITPKNWTVP